MQQKHKYLKYLCTIPMAMCQATECATVEIITQQIKVFIDLLFEFSSIVISQSYIDTQECL